MAELTYRDAVARGIVRREDIAMLISVYFSVLIGFSPLQALLGVEPAPGADVIAQRAALATAHPLGHNPVP